MSGNTRGGRPSPSSVYKLLKTTITLVKRKGQIRSGRTCWDQGLWKGQKETFSQSVKCSFVTICISAGVHLKGAAAAGDETATNFSSSLLIVGRKVRSSIKPEAPAHHIQGKSTNHECLKAIFTHRNDPEILHTLNLLFNLFYFVTLLSFWWWFIDMLYSETHFTSRAAHIQLMSGDVIQQLGWKRQPSDDYWQPSVLDSAQRPPKRPAFIQEEKPNHCKGVSSRQNLDVVHERKSASCAVWPRFLHIYINSRGAARSTLCARARKQNYEGAALYFHWETGTYF